MNCYAIDQQQTQLHTDRSGRPVREMFWVEVLQIQAPRAARALRAADGKWAGRLHRARLISGALRAPCRLSADDRALIHQLTHQTI